MAKVKCQSKANPTRLKPPIKRIMQSNVRVQRIGTATVSLLTTQPRKAEQIIFLPFLRYAFRLHRTGSRPVGVVTFQRGLDETRRGSCSQEEVSAPTSRKKKKLKKQNKKPVWRRSGVTLCRGGRARLCADKAGLALLGVYYCHWKGKSRLESSAAFTSKQTQSFQNMTVFFLGHVEAVSALFACFTVWRATDAVSQLGCFDIGLISEMIGAFFSYSCLTGWTRILHMKGRCLAFCVL